MLTEKQMTLDLRALGLCDGDSVITHSSFKSLGEVEGGAQTVINSFRNAVGESGTVIFPTLCQEDWLNVYKNWHLDAPSDVGYLTNYFRKLPGALRSNQATHSVAAMGKDAEYITKTHGESGLRYGMFGDTPFAADSPWEKMYKLNTKIVFLGVNALKCTFRHYVEYCFVEEALNLIKDRPDFEELKAQIWCYERWDDAGVWPNINSEAIRAVLEKENKVHTVKCGNADVFMFTSQDFVNTAYSLLKKRDTTIYGLSDYPDLLKPHLDWLDKVGIFDKQEA